MMSPYLLFIFGIVGKAHGKDLAMEFHPNDEVFNLKTRAIGIVLSVKSLTEPVEGTFLRVQIKSDLPDQIWPLEETSLWFRQKRYMESDKP
jgi:hypothetical protein